MLIAFIAVYIFATLLIGFFAARLVKNSNDFLVAGRKLPFVISTTALFATWFGSETILGASSEFIHHGMIGVMEDPFGAALCLLLVGIFFAKVFYNMDLITFADFFRNRYNPAVEFISSVFIIFSYFGWISAQFVAFAIILNIISGISIFWGIVIATVVVLIYTYAGGMWAVSLADFIQSIVIIIGLLIIAVQLVNEVGGLHIIVQQSPPGFFNILPEPNTEAVLKYIAALMVIGLGSIPQQDVFQRVISAESSKTAVKAAYTASFLYVTVGMLPLLIALCAKYLHPEMLAADGQYVLPNMVLQHSSVFMQILFFGALLSAIMSTASGAILAPATILAENIIKPRMVNIDEKKFLLISRLSVIVMAVIGFLIANTGQKIYDLVGNSSTVSLVSLFVPLVAGIWWKPANTAGAMLAMFGGIVTWVLSEHYGVTIFGVEIPGLIVGLVASLVGMLIGSLVQPRLISSAQ